MTLLKLCAVFFYIGLFTVGGGQVAITLMQQEFVDRGIIPADIFFNMVAISESTPGPIGINMATYLGCKLYGVFGGILTTFFTVLPSLIVILIVAKFMARVNDSKIVKSGFSTLRPVVAGLVAVACWKVIELAVVQPVFTPIAGGGLFPEFWILSAVESLPVLVFYVFGSVAAVKTKLHPVALILCGAVFGVLFL